MHKQRLLLITSILVQASVAPLFLAEIARPQTNTIPQQVSPVTREG
jgi:hypothetical protein